MERLTDEPRALDARVAQRASSARRLLRAIFTPLVSFGQKRLMGDDGAFTPTFSHDRAPSPPGRPDSWAAVRARVWQAPRRWLWRRLETQAQAFARRELHRGQWLAPTGAQRHRTWGLVLGLWRDPAAVR